MSDSPVPAKAQAWVQLHAQAEAVRAKQLAGQRLSEEEEAILEREATLAAELRQDRERQERRASRAGAGCSEGAGAVAPASAPSLLMSSACLPVHLPPPKVLAPPPPPLAG